MFKVWESTTGSRIIAPSGRHLETSGIVWSVTWKINKRLNCSSYNIVYLIECNKEKCKQRYIGETKRPLSTRLANHRDYIVNRHIDRATKAHFTSPGHNVSNITITILEQVKFKNEAYRKQREKYFIKKFNTLYEGMNRQNWTGGGGDLDYL